MDVERALEPFQVYLDDQQLNERLAITRQYADSRLVNCSNLVLVLLGIVDPNYYLGVCSRRGKPTSIDEIIGYVKSSLSQCGVENNHVEQRVFHAKDAQILFKSLTPNHAIPLGLHWKAGGIGHSVLLRKNAAGELQYIDPQTFGGFGGVYPFKVSGEFAVSAYLNENINWGSLLFSYSNIDEANSKSKKCMTTMSPMDIEGGKKRRLRKNGKKTKKSRKHHGVRTRRGRHRVR